MNEEWLERFVDWREIDVPCTSCRGSGSIVYGSTATWRGGIGGAAMTKDVCNRCWGSGDENHKWTNLKVLENKKEYRQDVFRALEFFVEQMEKFGDWDDGCFYYNKVSAPELQRPIDFARKVISKVKKDQ